MLKDEAETTMNVLLPLLLHKFPGVEILSMGKSLEVIKDLGNAKMVCDRYNLELN